MTSLVVALTAATGAIVIFRRMRRRRRRIRLAERIQAAIPDTVELLILILQAGSAPAQAIRELRHSVDPVLVDAFDRVIAQLDRGHRLADALGVLVADLGPSIRSVVDAIATADRYGLELTTVLERRGTEARIDRRRSADTDARKLSVRLTFPLVICILPAFVLLAIAPALTSTLASIRGLDSL